VVDRLRTARAPEHGGMVVLAATDPASPWGAALAWPAGVVRDDGTPVIEPTRRTGASVVLHDGAALLWVAPGGKRIATLSGVHADEQRAVQALSAWAATGREGITLVTEVDGVAVRGSRWEPLLREAGFAGDYRGMVLSKKPGKPFDANFQPVADAAPSVVEAPEKPRFTFRRPRR
jgi:ATP-dependent Lhr-like helicase